MTPASHRVIQRFLFICTVFILASCQPSLKVHQIAIDQQELTQGDKALITVMVKGPKDQVESVEATVMENPDFRYTLNDQGESGDQVAGDNIWSYQVTVPYEAPPGIYTLEFRVTDKEGK